MAIGLLGPVQVTEGHQQLDLGGPRPTRALVALVAAPQRSISVAELAEQCFDDNDRPDDPVPAIRTAIRRLRRAMGDEAVLTRPGGYRLDPDRHEVDIDRFDRLIAEARRATDDASGELFGEALDLWRGQPFGDLGSLPWLEAERIRLEEQHVVALEGWHEAQLRVGSATEILPSLAAAVQDHPLRDRLHRQLMRGLFLAGRQPDALRAFQSYRAVMADVGLEVSQEARRLEQEIAGGDPDGTLRPVSLRGYRIEERIGEGAFSIVYRSTQPVVDRPVAIKQIRAELADQPDFIRSFETEARMVARLEHPHVVPLYDYWREPGSAYLVMRLLDGGTLESSLLDGRWEPWAVARMVEEVGSALAYAHRAGVIHRDVKPANILLDDLGHAYLTDFGIATKADATSAPQDALSVGSPAYASPEQLLRRVVGSAADVHGLAISAYEALVGRLPFPDERTQADLLQRQLNDPVPPPSTMVPGLSSAVDAVIRRATAKDPAERTQDIEQFAADLVAALVPSPGAVSVRSATETTIVAENRNPYKGLRAFDEADAVDFGGRERLVAELAGAAEEHRLVAVVGPSGAGKSSAVRAGLLPALRAGVLPGSEDWFITSMLPGSRPLEELEAALVRIAIRPDVNLLWLLKENERGLSRALRRVLPADAQLVLIVDQFEEVFVQCEDDEERNLFLAALVAAVTEHRSPLRVVLTVRADFYDRPLAHEGLGRLVRDGTVAVLPLAPDELERAIVEPAERVGCSLESGLVAEIVADVADRPGALPLLQFALTELYERRVGDLMTRAAYAEIGGLGGALASRAEELYGSLDVAEQESAKRLFTRLVSVRAGSADTRRVATRAELVTPGLLDVADRFGAARLLRFDRDAATREPTVELAHEALLVEWPRLQRWLDENREGLIVRRQLAEAAEVWEQSGRHDADLYRGPRLSSAQRWSEANPRDLTQAEDDFLVESVSRRTREEAAEASRLRDQVRSNRRLRALLAVTVVVALVAAAAGLVALRQRSDAQRSEERAIENSSEALAAQEQAQAAEVTARVAQEEAQTLARDAEIRRMISDSAALRERDPALAMLVALAAHGVAPRPDTLGALQSALARSDGYLGVLAAAKPWPDELRGETYFSIDFVGDHTLVAGSRGILDVWDLRTGKQVASLPPPPMGTAEADGLVSSLGDDRLLVVSIRPSNTRLELIDAQTGDVLSTAAVEGVSVQRVTHLNGRIAADTPDGEVLLFDDELVEVGRFEVPRFGIRDLALTPSGLVTALGPGVRQTDADFEGSTSVLAGIASDGTERWAIDAEPIGQAAGVELGLDFFFEEVEADPTGSLVYATARGFGVWIMDPDVGTVRDYWPEVTDIGPASVHGRLSVTDDYVSLGFTVLDRLTGQVVRSVPPPDGRAPVVAISPSGSVMAVDGPDGIDLWSLDGTQLLGTPVASSEGATAAWSDPSRSRVAWADPPSGVVGIGGAQAAPVDLPVEPSTVALSPAGDVVTYGSETGYSVWGGDSLDLVGSTGEQPLRWSAFMPTPDGRFGVLAGHFVLGEAGVLHVYDLQAQERIASIEDLRTTGSLSVDQVERIAFSEDGSTMAATTGSGRFGLFDVATWEAGLVLDSSSDDERIRDVAFSPAGDVLALLATSGAVLWLDVGTGDIERGPTVSPPSPMTVAGMRRIGFGVDPRHLVVGSTEGLQIWDSASGSPVGTMMANDGLVHGTVVADGRTGLTSIGDRLLRWDLDAANWPAIACRAAGRDLTAAEWQRYAPADEPQRSLCP